MPTTEGYNGTFTGPQIDEAIAKTKNAITASNGGELDMAESLGDGPYVIEFTEETSSGGSGGMTEEEADARYLKLAGGTLTGAVDMGGNAVTNLPAPVNDGDAARKADVEAVDNNLTAHTGDTNNPHAVTAAQVGALPLSGGVMTGPITGIVTPTASDMPASKGYVDDAVSRNNGFYYKSGEGLILPDKSISFYKTSLPKSRPLFITVWVNQIDASYIYFAQYCAMFHDTESDIKVVFESSTTKFSVSWSDDRLTIKNNSGYSTTVIIYAL